MVDIENYEKLRGKLSRMFLEGVNLMEENDFRLDLVSDSMNPKVVLKIARDMEGNSMFRLGKVDDALEIYGYTETLLVKSKFEEEADKIELGSNLYYRPRLPAKNVKAMYRRAMSAIGLGRQEWAYWDLEMAVEIRPSNQEVIKKLEE
ncbi:Protein unc-45-like protein B, partial [Bienertia sinuspersici]